MTRLGSACVSFGVVRVEYGRNRLGQYRGWGFLTGPWLCFGRDASEVRAFGDGMGALGGDGSERSSVPCSCLEQRA